MEWGHDDRPRSRAEWALRCGKFVVDQAIWRQVCKAESTEATSPAKQKPAGPKKTTGKKKPAATPSRSAGPSGASEPPPAPSHVRIRWLV